MNAGFMVKVYTFTWEERSLSMLRLKHPSCLGFPAKYGKNMEKKYGKNMGKKNLAIHMAPGSTGLAF